MGKRVGINTFVNSRQDEAAPHNVVASTRAVRTYAEVAELSKLNFTPTLGFTISGEGTYLVHYEGNGNPHCVAVTVGPSPSLIATVCDDDVTWGMPLHKLSTCAGESIDAATIVTFRVTTKGQASSQTPPDAALMQLQAGGVKQKPSSSYVADTDMAQEDSSEGSDVDMPQEPIDDDDSVIKIGDRLLDCLANEVKAAVKQVDRSGRSRLGSWKCTLCPFRSFARKQHLVTHLRQQHRAGKQFVCSGTKQLRAIIAMWDNNQLLSQPHGDYLAQSARVMAQSIVPALDSRHNLIDRDIRLLLTDKGPVFVNLRTVDESNTYRRVGNTYYTREFAEIIKSEALVNKARARTILPRLAMRFMEAGSTLASLVPSWQETIWCILEDVFMSPVATLLQQRYVGDMVQSEEMESLSLDCTMRITMTLMGQAHWRADQETKASAVIPESESLRRILTIRGRTGAVMGILAIPQESVEFLAQAMLSNLDERVRAGVRCSMEKT